MMELWYNDVAVHGLGEVTLLGEARKGLPEGAPVKWEVTLRCRLEVFEGGWRNNRALLAQFLNAGKTQGAVLTWKDPAGDVLVSRAAVLAGPELSDPHEVGGETNQRLEFSFVWSERVTPRTDGVIFKKNDAGGGVSLGTVSEWSESYGAERFHKLRPGRRQQLGVVSAKGQWVLEPEDFEAAEATRQGLVNAQVAALRAEFNCASGRLTRGAFFDQVVKVTGFTPEVNRDSTGNPDWTGVSWSVAAEYTQFPDEAEYAAAEFVVSQRTAKETGEVTVGFKGKIDAQNQVAAEAKLLAIRAGQLTAAGVPAERQNAVRSEVSSVNVSANDGEIFIELSFEEEYRYQSGAIVSWTLKQADAENLQRGLIQTTLSGTVVAGGLTADAAWAAAVAKARVLGSGKYALCVESSEGRNDRLLDETGAPVGVRECVGCEFSYVYLRKGSKVYIEAATESVRASTSGEFTESVSGYVVADTLKNAEREYRAKIKQPYLDGKKLILEEKLVENRQHYKAGADYVAHGAADNKMPVEVRLDFQLRVWRDRGDGETFLAYSVSTGLKRTENLKETRVEGYVLASSATRAEAFLTAFLAGLGYGALKNPAGTRRSEWVQSPADPYGPYAEKVERCGRLSFEESYVSSLGQAGLVLACELSEEILWPGVRWVVHKIPDGVCKVQNCGVESGRRSVRGRVLATSAAKVEAWQTAKLGPFTGTSYVGPLEQSTAWRWLPLTEGVAQAGKDGAVENWHVCERSFSQGQILV